MSPGSPKRENPALLEQDGVSEGIEALPQRVDRYGKAKKGALDIGEYMGTLPQYQDTTKRLLSCGDYLVFNHYWTVDKVKLHGARLCCMPLLCPLCAIRRGAKALGAYLDRWEVIKAEKPMLRPFLVTLTVKDGEDLEERFKHLQKAQHELWKRKHRGRGSSLDGVAGAVWSYEFKRGKNSGLWHPHLHMIALAWNGIDQEALAAEWHNITGDSFIVDVRPIDQTDEAAGFMEVFKYAIKFSDQPPADTVHSWCILKGKRLFASSGCFRDVQVPESMMDDEEGLQSLPYVQLFYSFAGKGYTLNRRREMMPSVTQKGTRHPDALRVHSSPPPSYSAADFQAAYEVRILRAQVHQPIGKQAL
jgi:hypothetical protein